MIRISPDAGNRLRCLLLILGGLIVSGCATGRGLPYDAWSLNFFAAPPSMEAWIETATVEDMASRLFFDAGGGIVSGAGLMTAADIAKNRDGGWPERITNGSGRYVTGATFPKRIYVRWQSLVEPQTYRVTFTIPESARLLMQRQEYDPRYPGDKSQRFYREFVVIGLAPGGIARLWISGPGLDPIPVLCVQAEVEPLGPDLGQYQGRYVTLSKRSKEYIATHAIPYESWRCE